MVEWPQLKTVSNIISFLRLAGHFSKFIKGFSLVTSPMTKLTRKWVKFLWDEKYEQSFQYLKKNLTSAPVPTLPNLNKTSWSTMTHQN